MGTTISQSSFFGVILFLLFGVLGEVVILAGGASSDSSFDVNYYVTWGSSNVLSLNDGGEIQLSMDKSSGSGFASKQSYGSGFFHMRIKLPDKDSAGVVTAYYLTSHTDKHDELDFEFLGNREGRPYTLQTNVFSNGEGNREQRIHLWFDPTADFHDYKVLWNQHLIVFYVDDIPFRVFKNNANIGVSYPTQPMQVEASLWDGDSWATDGGQTKTNWSQAPFKAHFQGFNIDGCPSSSTTTQGQCYSSNFWWNQEKYWKLDSNQQKAYENVRNNYMTYDYCSDRPRYPKPPAECLDQ
ncbi:xyloglucan endotransglucosylase/hydrolase protein 2-like [Rhododendron vialii]|uniref:xyloglucan endotransglucosylase/hydrolase protein 2-like n=1 Tax=Rhododendron vialii TaxID=182163 RepID=UPI00265E3970|nr:xyloglucan endotransglucosylase/hydrolase protein 2-like [Rhododendron vialii]